MPDLTAREIAEKQVRNAQAASAAYTQGIERTTKNPMERAAAQKAKLLNNFTDAVNSGRWEEGLRAVSMEEWKRLAREKGGANYARGVAAALPKITRFWESWKPIHDQIKAQVDAMPSDTEGARDAKMMENIRLRRAARRGRSRR